MKSTTISMLVITGAILCGLGGSTSAAASTGALAVPDRIVTATTSFSLAPQAQDEPGAPIPSATPPAASDAPAATDPVVVDPAPNVPAPATTKAVTTKTSTKAATKAVTKAATVPAAPKTTAPAAPGNTYKPPSNVGVLTLSCTWTGTRVTALAQWSGYPGVVIVVSAPGLTDSSGIPVITNRVNGTVGLHGACTASGGGQSKSASA